MSVSEKPVGTVEELLARHRAAALANPDPVGATVGIINNYLIELAITFYGAVQKRAVSSAVKCGVPADATGDNYLRTFVQLTRQIERFTRLEVQGRDRHTKNGSAAVPSHDQPSETTSAVHNRPAERVQPASRSSSVMPDVRAESLHGPIASIAPAPVSSPTSAPAAYEMHSRKAKRLARKQSRRAAAQPLQSSAALNNLLGSELGRQLSSELGSEVRFADRSDLSIFSQRK